MTSIILVCYVLSLYHCTLSWALLVDALGLKLLGGKPPHHGKVGFNRGDSDCVNINSVNALYLNITHSNGYIEEKGVNKHLVVGSTDENKELLKKYDDFFNRIKDKIKKNK